MVDPHLRYLRPQKAPRDVRHAKSHRLERLRRMVALWGRKLEDPSRLFLQRYETRSLDGASSRGTLVKKMRLERLLVENDDWISQHFF